MNTTHNHRKLSTSQRMSSFTIFFHLIIVARSILLFSERTILCMAEILVVFVVLIVCFFLFYVNSVIFCKSFFITSVSVKLHQTFEIFHRKTHQKPNNDEPGRLYIVLLLCLLTAMYTTMLPIIIMVSMIPIKLSTIDKRDLHAPLALSPSQYAAAALKDKYTAATPRGGLKQQATNKPIVKCVWGMYVTAGFILLPAFQLFSLLLVWLVAELRKDEGLKSHSSMLLTWIMQDKKASDQTFAPSWFLLCVNYERLMV